MEKIIRILLVDDTASIHNDFYKILASQQDIVSEDAAILFDIPQTTQSASNYQIDSAYQGKEALALVRQSLLANKPYAVAFIDMRMPPGWDGVETIKHIWEVDPTIQMVICTAYSDHSWEEITHELGSSDNLLILKKPFEIIEINQLAAALSKKWGLIAHLNALVKARTTELENMYSLTHATLDSIEEGILAATLDNNISLYNKNFLEQWDISETELKSFQSKALFQQLSQKVEETEHFLEVMNDLITHPKEQKNKEWQLKNGKHLELYVEPHYLHHEIIGVVYSFRDITERKILEKQLLHQATHDLLTGLPNRALLMDRINQAIAHAKRFNLFVAILLLDLDSFKQVNDSLGHKAGDIVLKCQAERLKNFVRANDTVARLGGDEFVVVLAAQPDEHHSLALLNRLVTLFLMPCKVEHHELMITASIGVSIYPRDSTDPDELLKQADVALYRSKELGGNHFHFYEEALNRDIMKRVELKLALSNALHNNELTLHYQPLYDLCSSDIIGMEALLRWDQPTIGAIPPKVFIPIAEESGLILAIGEWVLKTACTQMQAWNKLRQTPLKISVNISVKQFRHTNFVDLIRRVLAETQLSPSCLELEITEGLILGNVAEILEKMQELKDLGLRFAIDDFGMGYSSLSYLKYFPFDTVKIDKAFIDNVTNDPNDASIVEAIIGMTKSMNIDVLAEGVEKAEQVTYLRDHHSDQVQGYYFSKPLSVEESTALLIK